MGKGAPVNFTKDVWMVSTAIHVTIHIAGHIELAGGNICLSLSPWGARIFYMKQVPNGKLTFTLEKKLKQNILITRWDRAN